MNDIISIKAVCQKSATVILSMTRALLPLAWFKVIDVVWRESLTAVRSMAQMLEASGKLSTWFPPRELVGLSMFEENRVLKTFRFLHID